MINSDVSGAGQLFGTLTLPPDKSISHRAAMFAALAEGESTIENYSEAADPQSTLHCLRQLGVQVRQEDRTVHIEGAGRSGFKTPDKDLDCGNSGTTMRLMSGIIAGAGVQSRLIGDQSLSARTMRRILDPLKEMGGVIQARESNYAPIEIYPHPGIQAIRYSLPIASAQLKSTVLLAGLFGEETTEVIEHISSRDHTERLLQLPVVSNGNGRVIQSSLGHNIPVQNYRVPGDFSAAAFWLVAGAIHPDAEIILKDVGLNPSRIAAMRVLQEMGAEIEIEESATNGPEPVGTVTVRSSKLRSIDLDPSIIPNCIDELPILMVAMCFTEGRSEITGAGELRHKETDRLEAMANLLKSAGEKFELRPDGILIQGRGVHKPDSAVFDSEHDHRIAMSAAVMALMAGGTSTVRNSDCTSISYPEFWSDLETLKSHSDS